MVELLGKRPSEGDSGRWPGAKTSSETCQAQDTRRVWKVPQAAHSPPCSLVQVHPYLLFLTPIPKHPSAGAQHWMCWTWVSPSSLNTFQVEEAEGRTQADVIQLHWNQTRQSWRMGNTTEFHTRSKGSLGKERERGAQNLKNILIKKPSHCQNINPKPRFGQICSCLTFSMRSGLNLSILGNSWWMQCNKVLINTCPALRLIWRRINGGLSTSIFSNYGRWLYL